MNPTRDEALAAVEVLRVYLENTEAAYTPPAGKAYPDDPQHWNDAAAWCRVLLEAANRDDHHGCPLCRS